MDSVTILRQLWRSRRLVVLAAVFAVVVAFALTCRPAFPPKPKSYTVGVATARILVDTPRSQVIEVDPKGSDTLGSRASVLANLMVDGELEADVARRAGVSPKKLVATSQAAPGTDAGPALDRDSYALSTSVLTNSDLAQLPIIKVQTQAPDVAKAARVATAAVQALSDYLDAKAAAEHVKPGRRLRVSGLGPPAIEQVHRGQGMLMGVGVAVLLFALGCAAILVFAALRASWRTALAHERAAGEQMLDADTDDFAPFLESDATRTGART